MLKRSVWLILVLCLSLTACSMNTPTVTPSETTAAAPKTTPSSTPKITPTPEVYVTFRPDLDTTSKASYTITTVRDTRPIVSQQDEVLIEYPQVENFGDAKKEAQLNKMLKDHFFDSIELKEEEYVENCPADLSLGYYDVNITYTVTMQTKELLSIVYSARILKYSPGGPDVNPRPNDCGGGHTIVIDLNTMKRLKLSDFTSTAIEIPYPEERYGNIEGIDLYYRIKNSKTVYDPTFQSLEMFTLNNQDLIASCLPFLFEGVDVPEYNFCLMEDGVYYMTSKEHPLYVKILAETEWEWPLG